MSEEGLQVIYPKKKRGKYSSYAGEISQASENPVNRDFHSEKPNELRPTGITEFKLPDDNRKIHLSPIVGRFDGALPSRSMGLAPNADLANSSLIGGCSLLDGGEHPVCRNDRGCHCRWPGWMNICEEHGMIRSMSRKGRSPDNAACEGFFGRLKNEFFYCRDWRGVTAEEFIGRLDSWLVHCNENRNKESLGWMSPMQYRRSLGLVA